MRASAYPLTSSRRLCDRLSTSRTACLPRSARELRLSKAKAATGSAPGGDSVSSRAQAAEAAPAMARGGQSTHGGASSSGRHHSHNPLLLAVNESTKWLVSGAAGLFLLLRHDAPVMWCLLGALFSSFLNKALKHVINESRPANARKADPGMPSSHANSLAFLGAYSAATLLTSSSPDQSLATSSYLGAAALAAGSAFLAWLRIALGYHTAPQVLVGFLLGASTALAWLALGTRYALPALARHPYYQAWLTGATYVAVAMFIARNLLSWVQGLRYMRTAGPVPAVQKQ